MRQVLKKAVMKLPSILFLFLLLWMVANLVHTVHLTFNLKQAVSKSADFSRHALLENISACRDAMTNLVS